MTVADGVVKAKGSKGELELRLHPNVRVAREGEQLVVTVKHPDEKSDRSKWGLFRALLQNLITGVSEGYEKRLEVNGVGFKVQVQGKDLVLHLGFSHPIEYPIPEGIAIQVEKNVIVISGIDKQLVGETAAQIRALKKPEPYKGKGIKYADETIRRKAGKVVKAAGGGPGAA